VLSGLPAIFSTELGFFLELESGIGRMPSIPKALFHNNIRLLIVSLKTFSVFRNSRNKVTDSYFI